MPEPRRLLRLQQLVLETLATAVQRDVEDPRVAGVTITRVKLSKDLSRAIVFWSNLEPGGPRRTAERGLHDALHYLQAIVAESMSTRQTPHLTFRFDEGLERAGRMGSIFDQIARERGETPSDETKPEIPDEPADDADDGDDGDDEA
jgi:ribosome-binding factor A